MQLLIKQTYSLLKSLLEGCGNDKITKLDRFLSEKIKTSLPFNEAAFLDVSDDVAGGASLRVTLLADDDAHLAGRVLLEPQHLELLAGQRRQRRRQVRVRARVLVGALRS